MKGRVIIFCIISLLLCLVGGCSTDQTTNLVSDVDVQSSDQMNNENYQSDEVNYQSGDIVSLQCNSATTTMITRDNAVVLWGNNTYGAIGDNTIDDQIHQKKDPPPSEYKLFKHPPYKLLFNQQIVSLLSDTQNSCAITNGGELYMWGVNINLWDLNNIANNPSAILLNPQKVDLNFKVKQISLSWNLILLLAENGEVYRSGTKIEDYHNYNDYSYRAYDDPKINGFKKIDTTFVTKKISTSPISYCFLSDTNEVYIQGIIMGDYPREEKDLVFPKITKIRFPEKITDIAALITNVIALGESGKLYVYGNQGVGIVNDSYDQKIGDNLYEKNIQAVTQISGSNYAVMATVTDGSIYSWGMDEFGTIVANKDEYGKREFIYEPVQKKFENKISRISMGESTASVIDEKGNVFMWGSNKVGQIYNLTDDYTDVPYKVNK